MRKPALYHLVLGAILMTCAMFMCHLKKIKTQCSLVLSCKREVQIANMMFIGLNKQSEVQLTLTG